MQLYIGTYISESEKAIYHLDIDDNTYKVFSNNLIHSGKNPSFLIFNKKGDRIYCVNEMNGEDGSICSLYKEKGKYKMGNKLSTQGNNPCHLCLSRDEGFLFVTNYASGSLCIYSIDNKGELERLIDIIHFQGRSVHRDRQESSHPHQVLLSPDGTHLLMTDLGCDCIRIFKINSQNKNLPLTLVNTIKTPNGSGPRHMTFDEKASILYVSAELSSTVLVFNYEDKNLFFSQEITLFSQEDTPYPKTSCSEIAYFNGYIYVANRGDDTLSICKQKEDGRLVLLKHVKTKGNTPRHFLIITSHDKNTSIPLLVVGNQDSNSLVIFKIKADNLVLLKIIEPLQKPVCISVG